MRSTRRWHWCLQHFTCSNWLWMAWAKERTLSTMSMLAAKSFASGDVGWWRLVELSLGYQSKISQLWLFHAFHPKEKPLHGLPPPQVSYSPKDLLQLPCFLHFAQHCSHSRRPEWALTETSVAVVLAHLTLH